MSLHWSKHIILSLWPPFLHCTTQKPGLYVIYFLHYKCWIALTALCTQKDNKLKAGKQYLQIEGQFPLRQNSCMAWNVGHGYVKYIAYINPNTLLSFKSMGFTFSIPQSEVWRFFFF